MLNILNIIIHNFKVLGIVISIGIFFAGLNRMIDSFVPNNFKWGMILCMISISLLLLDDGKISELNSSIAKDIAAISNYDR